MEPNEIAEMEELVKKLPKVERVLEKKENMIYVRADGGLFRAVMSVAYKYGQQNMSEVVRRCIVKALDEVETDLKKEKEARDKALSKFA
jgi:coenzyme F420-reducing hydrogenase beta subunit